METITSCQEDAASAKVLHEAKLDKLSQALSPGSTARLVHGAQALAASSAIKMSSSISIGHQRQAHSIGQSRVPQVSSKFYYKLLTASPTTSYPDNKIRENSLEITRNNPPETTRHSPTTSHHINISIVRLFFVYSMLQILPSILSRLDHHVAFNLAESNTFIFVQAENMNQFKERSPEWLYLDSKSKLNEPRGAKTSFNMLLDEDINTREREQQKLTGQHHHNHHRYHRKQMRARRHHDNYYEADRPVVATRKGLVRGFTQKIFTGKFVDAFLGIPYAKPPIGRYRFRHPQPLNAWSGELDASRFSSSCYQINDTFFGNFPGSSVWNANTPLNEDCLYLNIWTPFGIANTTVPTPSKVYRPPEQSQDMPRRPVLVWIFGGGFYSGTSSLSLYEGGVLASEEDIIVVSMNYRVSSLGFLYFGRPDAPGNAGLFDQLMALQWINDNIDQFGGDPKRVTIFGESAGAVSISFHLLSPLSRNLFNQAILQSGAATCPWGSMEPREIMSNGLQLADLVNCPSNGSDMEAVVECLLKVEPMALVSQDIGRTDVILRFPFVPVVDGSFLLEPPLESLIKSNFKPARILLGSNYDEGNAFLIYQPEFSQCSGSSQAKVRPALDLSHRLPDDTETGAIVGELRSVQPIESLDLFAGGRQSYLPQMASGAQSQHNLNINASSSCRPSDYMSLTRDQFFNVLMGDVNSYSEHPLAREAIEFEYSNWNNPHNPLDYDALDKIVGDYYFTCRVNEFGQRYASAGNSVFMYYFKQRSTISPWPKWMGVLHADEINFVFGEPLNQMFNYTAKEVELSKRMMKYWANFARYGNPTKLNENVSMPEVWPDYADKRQYLELHSDFVRVGRGPRARQCAFWAHHLPKLIESFDRSQCKGATHQHYIHPLEARFVDTSQRNVFLSNVPSSVLVSFSVILVLTIICLLVYAKQTGKLHLSLSSSANSSN